MQQTRVLIFLAFASIAVTASGPKAASAQDASTTGGYQLLVTPYLWLASVHATTLTPLAREPQINSSVSTIDLLSHLEGAPFMGSFEARYGNLGFLADAIHLPVSTKVTTRDIFFQSGNAALKADTGTGIALYRFLQDAVQFADGGLGFRAWGFSSNLALNPGLLPGVALNRTGSWADPADRRTLSPRARQWFRAHHLW